MWYNTLPSAAIIAVCLAVPTVWCTLVSYPLNGNWSGRDLTSRWKRHKWARDQRLTGVEGNFVFHYVSGLDGIPDD